MRFFYGARTEADLFYRDEFASLAHRMKDFKIRPGVVACHRRRRMAR